MTRAGGGEVKLKRSGERGTKVGRERRDEGQSQRERERGS